LRRRPWRAPRAREGGPAQIQDIRAERHMFVACVRLLRLLPRAQLCGSRPGWGARRGLRLCRLLRAGVAPAARLLQQEPGPALRLPLRPAGEGARRAGEGASQAGAESRGARAGPEPVPAEVALGPVRLRPPPASGLPALGPRPRHPRRRRRHAAMPGPGAAAARGGGGARGRRPRGRAGSAEPSGRGCLGERRGLHAAQGLARLSASRLAWPARGANEGRQRVRRLCERPVCRH
ncbi:unnamed protein product, partial [Prorocentrum cordatum]